jgi:hypothetical protein
MSIANVLEEIDARRGQAGVTAYTQTYSTASRTVPAATVVAVAGATPAGGTGATAGAYDTAANRDILIATCAEMKVSINALIDDVLILKKNITAIIDDLQTLKLAT